MAGSSPSLKGLKMMAKEMKKMEDWELEALYHAIDLVHMDVYTLNSPYAFV